MAGIVVIGCADQSVAYELRSQLAEAADVEVVGVAETTTELTAMVIQNEPNLVLVHDQLGPEPVHQVVRDLSAAAVPAPRPGTATRPRPGRLPAVAARPR